MQFVPRIKSIRQTNREPFSIPPKCSILKRKGELEKRPTPLEYTDPSKLLLLVHSFLNRTTSGIEKKLNKYFKKELSAQNVVITLFLKNEVQLGAVGNVKLRYTQRYLLQSNIIEDLRQKCKKNEGELPGELHADIQKIFKEILGDDVSEIISIPLITPNTSIVKLVMVSVVHSSRDRTFIVNCIRESFRFCMNILLNTLHNDIERKKKVLYERSLAVLKHLYYVFQKSDDVVWEILIEAVRLTNSSEGILYLIDKNFNDINAELYSTMYTKTKFVNLLKYKGIAGETARTGTIRNIKKSNPQELENLHRLNIETSLSFPICNGKTMVCVVQVYNKRGADYTLDDADVGYAFSDNFGLVLAKSIEFKYSQRKSMQTQMISATMTHHIKFDDAATEQILTCPHNYPDFDTFEFHPRKMLPTEAETSTLRVFESLNLLRTFKIPRKSFAKFILHIKMGYLDMPYHNWMLAFNALHFVHAVIFNLQLIQRNIITNLEALALLIAAMAHALDFRGHPFSLKLQLGHSLQNMYWSSEHLLQCRHFAQLVHILNLEYCNIFTNMDNDTYVEFFKLVRQNIYMTDIKTYLAFRNELGHLPDTSITRMKVIPPRVKKLLFAVLLNVAIVSDFFRSFKTSLLGFRLIHKEIQETKDYAVLPHNVLPNTRKYNINELHRWFFKVMLKPQLLILEYLLPELPKFYEMIHVIKMYWKYSKNVFDEYMLDAKTSMEVLFLHNFEEKLLNYVVTSDERSEFEEVELSEDLKEEEEEEIIEESSEEEEDEDLDLLAALDEESHDSLFYYYH